MKPLLYLNADDTKSNFKAQGLSFSATSSSTLKLYIHAMAFFDIGYLASLSSLTYYSSKSDGYGYHTEYQDEVFYLILPTCNIFKGKTILKQSLRNMEIIIVISMENVLDCFYILLF